VEKSLSQTLREDPLQDGAGSSFTVDELMLAHAIYPVCMSLAAWEESRWCDAGCDAPTHNLLCWRADENSGFFWATWNYRARLVHLEYFFRGLHVVKVPSCAGRM